MRFPNSFLDEIRERIPIADVTAMNYLSPIYVSIGAALLLGERLAFRRIAAIAFALIGALGIHASISDGGFTSGEIAILTPAFVFGSAHFLRKLLRNTK